MGRYTGKTCRLAIMIGLTASFFLVELVVGYIVNSLALVGDSYHMLSDVVALAIGFASVRISKWSSHKNTFGWARAEVLGALVNAVFLIALCFTIFVEALQRIFQTEEIENPDLMLIVGGVGLGINLIGLFMFGSHSHGHSHGGSSHEHKGLLSENGHSHDAHNHSHSFSGDDNGKVKHNAITETSTTQRTFGLNGEIIFSSSASPRHSQMSSANGSDDEDHEAEVIDGEIVIKKTKITSSAQLNMRGVFLHVLGDALGSVIVIISALIIKYVKADWKYKIDPAMSLVLVVIILCTTIPLLRESALILLQTVPTHIQVKDLRERLVTKVEGVLDLHEFHIWQLAGNRIIATAHIRCQNLRDYRKIAEDVKAFFHEEGIHSTTMQPEFVEYEELKPGRDCVLECGPDKTCFTDTCCGKTSKGSLKIKPSITNSSNVVRQRSVNTTHSASGAGGETHSNVVVNIDGTSLATLGRERRISGHSVSSSTGSITITAPENYSTHI